MPNEKEIYGSILELAKQQTILKLLESGVDVNFFDTINETLLTNFFNSGNIDDLVDELGMYITGGKEGVGALQKFITQVTSDSITQFNATYNQTLTDDLGIDWYWYTGTVIENTRPFCNHFVNGYYHKKEVKQMGDGTNPLTGKSLKNEGLIGGRIAATTSSTIFTYRGGWNCRHQFSPISLRYVNKSDIERNIKNGNFVPSEYEKKIISEGNYKKQAATKFQYKT